MYKYKNKHGFIATFLDEALIIAHFTYFTFIWSTLAINTFSSVTKRNQESKKHIKNRIEA